MQGKIALLAFLFTLAFAGSARANDIVAKLHDDPSGSQPNCIDHDCSLRQALANAQDGDTVKLQTGTYAVTQGTPLSVSKSISIEGASADQTTIDGAQNKNLTAPFQPTARVLTITGGSVSLSDLSIVNGNDEQDEVNCSGCSVTVYNGGGAIYASGAAGSLTISRVDFSGNAASIGGAISSRAPLTITDSNLDANRAAFGAGIFMRNNVSVVNSTFSNMGEYGGVLWLNSGAATVANATFFNDGTSSTIGGGITNFGATLALIDSTFAGVMRGALETESGASTTVRNTIFGRPGYSEPKNGACVTANQNLDDGRFTAAPVTHDNGSNLAYDDTCGLTDASSHNRTDPLLAPLNGNGAHVKTMALLYGSPALENGLGLHGHRRAAHRAPAGPGLRHRRLRGDLRRHALDRRLQRHRDRRAHRRLQRGDLAAGRVRRAALRLRHERERAQRPHAGRRGRQR